MNGYRKTSKFIFESNFISFLITNNVRVLQFFNKKPISVKGFRLITATKSKYYTPVKFIHID